MTKVDSALVRLLEEFFQAHELKQLLEREDWAASWLLDIPQPEHMAPNKWFHGLVRAVDQRKLRPRLRELLLRERHHREAEIDMVLPAMSPAPLGTAPPAVAPPVLPQPRSRVLRAGLVLTAAVAVLAFLALNYPTADDLTAPGMTPSQAPQGDLRLTVIYLDPPQAGGSRTEEWEEGRHGVPR